MPQSGGGGDDCGGLGLIIMIIVAVVVVVVTEGAASEWAAEMVFEASAAEGATAASVATAAATASAITTVAPIVAAAAGSIASQLVGMALGVVDEFSWKAVALSAISAGVSQGLPTGDLLGTTAGTIGNTIVRAAVANAMTQGIAVAVGLQDHFDWKGVAASAIGAGVGGQVGKGLGSSNSIGEQIFKAGLSGLAAGTATALARGGRISVQQIASDAFGNALGSSLGQQIVQGGQQEDRLGSFIEQNQPAWEQRHANYDQIVGVFGNPNQIDRSDRVMLAAGPGYGGMGGNSQRDENIARMLSLANRADPGSAESLRQHDGTYRVEINGTSTSADIALTDAQRSAMAAGYGPLSQEAAAAIRGGAYGAYEPSFQSFSNPRIQELFTGSFGNKLVDEFGRQEYIDSTSAKATDVGNRIDRGEISAREGAYEAAGFRDAEALRIRETSTTPESLRWIAEKRGDKPTDALVERATNPAAMRDYVDKNLYRKTEVKLENQGRPYMSDDVYREIAESSGRPDAGTNEKAVKAAEIATKVRAVGQVIGRTATVVGGVLDAASLASEIRTSVRTDNYDNTYQEGSRIAGGWAGAWVGGQAGAATGAALAGAAGTIFPVVGNAVGLAVGGVVGGLVGGAAGYFAGSKLSTSVYNFFKH